MKMKSGKENQSKLWACVVETAEEVGAATAWRKKLVKGGDEKQSNYCAAFVGRDVSFLECAELEETFDFVVKLNEHKLKSHTGIEPSRHALVKKAVIESMNFTMWQEVVFPGCGKEKITLNGHKDGINCVRNDNDILVPTSRELYLKLKEGEDHNGNGGLPFLNFNLNGGPSLENFINGSCYPSLSQEITPQLGESHEPIAVVGMACRLPGANNPSELWSLMMNKQHAMCTVPEGRWTPEQGCHLLPEHKQTQAGFLKCPVDTFDPSFFSISPAELGYTDPQARLLLQVAWESLENAGIDPTSLHSSDAGVFVGMWRDEYKDLLLQSTLPNKHEELRRYLGNSYGNSAARLSHFFKLTGPAVAPECGCSSSIVAIGLAMQALRRGETNLVLAGGANLLLKPFIYSDFQGVLSPKGHCQVYEANADGFARAEGCIVYVLKRLETAIKDGDDIKAVLRGFGMSQEGKSRSQGTPTVEGEALAMQRALRDSGVKPELVQWVEMHGTGTKVGDPIEMASTKRAYDVQGNKNKRAPLFVTSIKANIGHTESVSGAAGLMKVILSLENETIPPQLLNGKVNSSLDLQGVEILKDSKAWKQTKENQSSGQGETKKRIAGVSSFGITGTNAHLIVEEAPVKSTPLLKRRSSSLIRVPSPPSHFILPLSAHSEDALTDLMQEHATQVMTRGTEEPSQLKDYCFTAATGRKHFLTPFRAAVVSSSLEEIASLLTHTDSLSDGMLISNQKQSQSAPTNKGLKRPLCFLFPGQGCQYKGMGSSLHKTCPPFARHFDIVSDLLLSKYRINIKNILWEDEADNISLNGGLHSQLCIFALEYSLLKMWSTWGVVPSMVLGHSFGEFAAACAAGCLSLPTALELLVGMRTRLFAEVENGKMLVLRSNEDRTEELIKMYLAERGVKGSWVDVAAVNSNDQTVVSGPSDEIYGFQEWLQNKEGMKTTLVPVTHAFHSQSLDKICTEFEEVASSLSYGDKWEEVRYISSVDGRELGDAEHLNGLYWRRHMRQKVEFVKASKAAVELAGDLDPIFLEVGPHPLLSPLIAKNGGKEVTCIPSLRKSKPGVNNNCSAEWLSVLEAVGKLYVNGVDINWKKFYQSWSFKKVIALLPTYPFQNKEEFWFQPDDKDDDFGRGEKEGLLSPLLGREIATPLDSLRLYKNTGKSILKKEVGPYVKDHKIGDDVIFPFAGYITMAVEAALLKGEGPVCSLRDIKVFGGLPLFEEGGREFERELQGVHSFQGNDDEEEAKESTFKIFSRPVDGESCWKQHASLTVSSSTQAVSNPVIHAEVDGVVIEEDNLYNNMKELGYNFGPLFRSIKNLKKKDDILTCTTQINGSDCSTGEMIRLVDALIQASLLASSSSIPLDSLKLPVQIENLEINPSLLPKKDETLYIRAKGGAEAILYTKEGIIIASLKGLELVSTTLEKFQKACNLQKEGDVLPIYVEEWVASPQSPGAASELGHFDTGDVNMLPSVLNNAIPSSLTLEQRGNFKEIENSVRMGILSTLLKLGWISIGNNNNSKVKNSGELYVEATNTKLSQNFVNRLLHLATEHLTSPLQPLPSPEKLDEMIKTAYSKRSQLNAEWAFMKYYLEKLPSILNGKESILTSLFPQSGPTDFSAETLYTSFIQSTTLLKNLHQVITLVLKELKGKVASSTGPLKVLEVGGGTGSGTRVLLPLLEEFNIPYEYTFTDLSPTLVKRAEETFSKTSKGKMHFTALNVESEEIAQGFKNKWDMVLAVNVLHATRDMKKTCENLNKMMQPGGLLLVAEQHKATALVDIIFGNCEGYWLFGDERRVREGHCLMTREQWKETLRGTGFAQSVCIDSEDVGMGVTLGRKETDDITKSDDLRAISCNMVVVSEDHKNVVEGFSPGRVKFHSYTPNGMSLEGVDRIVFHVPSTTPANGSSLQELKRLTESFLHTIKLVISVKESKKPKVILVTQGLAEVAEGEVRHCDQSLLPFPAAAPLIGFQRTLTTEHPEIIWKWIDFDINSKIMLNSILQELESGAINETLVAYRSSVRYCAQMRQSPEFNTHLQVPVGNRYNLALPSTKSINDLKFIQAKGSSSGPLGEEDIEVKVSCSGLNFKDIFNVMKPTAEFLDSNGIGADFSGVVVRTGSTVTHLKIGDAVMGMNMKMEPLPSHVVCHSHSVAPLPSQFTHVEGATLPTAFLTSYHCLVAKANLQKGERVLIHSATGAVGLCAIQVALSLGATPFCTAGSKRKREYLRSVLGIRHVYSSRSLEHFSAGVRADTNGEGVHVILNSLTSPGFKEASLSCLMTKGRFIEMSKLNIWTPDQVSLLRSDVFYSVEDLSIKDLTRLNYLSGQLAKFVTERKLTPLPHTTFKGGNVVKALHHLEKAMHIGKVVVKLGDDESLFNERSTYLVTGGLGGIGLEVCKWILRNGGGKAVVCSRSANGLPEGLDPSNVVVKKVDVSCAEEVANLFSQIEDDPSLPPLRGIMHVAGVLDDATLSNQSIEKVLSSYKPKVDGAWNLHTQSLQRHLNLEHFVLFSSAMTVIGGPGQANYNAANSFLESLSNYRHNLGLPSTCVRWGQWENVGMTKGKDTVFGFRPFSVERGLKSLECLLNENVRTAVVAEWNPTDFQGSQWLKKYFQDFKVIKKQLNHKRGDKSDRKSSPKGSAFSTQSLSTRFWGDVRISNDESSCNVVIKKYVSETVQSILKIRGEFNVDENRELRDLGMDSLMFIELRNKLQALIGSEGGIVISSSDVPDTTSLNQISNLVASIVGKCKS